VRIVQPHSANRKVRWFTIVALFAILVLACVSVGRAVQNWTARAKARKLKNPVPSTSESLAAGLQLYQQHCQSCHGANGDGKGEKAQELSVAPGDFTDAKKMQSVTDGELYWQITAGRRPMPAFQDKVSEEGRWQLVDYIRTFAKETSKSQSGIRRRAVPAAMSRGSWVPAATSLSQGRRPLP
jgi:mono/diheme cytochrome c family protein